MTAPDDAVAAIDAALEAWESGPDAYRWEPDAEPGVARGPSYIARIFNVPDGVVDDLLGHGRRVTQQATTAPRPGFIRRIEEAQSRVVCEPDTAARLRNNRLPIAIAESEHVPPGTAYVFRPNAFLARSGASQRQRERP